MQFSKEVTTMLALYHRLDNSDEWKVKVLQNYECFESRVHSIKEPTFS